MTVIKYLSVYLASVLLMFVLQSIYVNNCLHWYSFLFTSGSYTCMALEKVLIGYTSNFGNILSVNIIHIFSLAVPLVTSFLGKSKQTEVSETTKNPQDPKSPSDTNSPSETTSETTKTPSLSIFDRFLKNSLSTDFSSTLLGDKAYHSQHVELPVGQNTSA